MVGIVSGNSTGLFQTAAGTIGQRGYLGQASQGTSGEKAYVNIATGNVVVQDRDAFVEGRGLDIALMRTYNSQGKVSDDNADGWWINGYRRIVNVAGELNTAGSSLQRISHDNSTLTYSYDVTSQRYQAQVGSGQFETIVFDAGKTTATWFDASGHNSETYEVAGEGSQWRLKSATDVNGNRLSYAYNGNLLASITNANGEALEFIYNGNNLTQERTRQSDGSIVTNTHYTYDTQNRLHQIKTDLSPEDNNITDGRVYTTTYTYEGDSNLLKRVVQTDGSESNFTYIQVGGQDRVETITDALGRVTRFTYDLASRTTTLTDAFGNKTSYVYDTQNRFTSITGPATEGTNASDTAAYITGSNSVRATARYTYNAAGQVETVTDAHDVVTTYHYNSRGQVTDMSDTAGSHSRFTYTAQFDLATSTVERQGFPTETTRHIYDAQRVERYQVSAQGRVTAFDYDGFGQKLSSRSYLQNAYDLSNIDANSVPSLNDMQAWSAAQDLTQTQLSRFDYNLRGQLKTLTRFSNVDSTGAGKYDGNESVTSYSYDVQGNLLQKIDPAHQQTSLVYGKSTYDGLNRLLSTTNAIGQSTVYQYDDAQHTATVQHYNGRVDTTVYDQAGQVLSRLTGGTAQTQYRYDALGRLGMSTDPTGLRHFNVYDATGNLRAEIDAKGRVTSYSYNALGQKIQTRVSSQVVTAAQMAALASQYQTGIPAELAGLSLIPADQADDLVAYSLYDDAGRLAYALTRYNDNNQYAVQAYQYDGAGNLIATTQHAKALVVGDALKHIANTMRAKDLVMESDVKDRHSYNYYDLDNRLVGRVDADAYLTQTRYDQAGQAIEVIRYAKEVTQARADSKLSDLLQGLARPDDQHSYAYYDGQGRQVGAVDANRYATSMDYDRNGRIISSTRFDTPVTADLSTQTAFAQVRPAFNALKDQTTTTHYNDLGQVDYKINAEGTKTHFIYNDMGQLITTMSAAGTQDVRIETQRYDQLGRVTATLSGEGSVALAAATTNAEIDAIWLKSGTTYAYDKAGRRISSTDTLGNKTFYYYDQLGNLSITINAEREVTVLSYDVRTNQIESKRILATRLNSLAGLLGGSLDKLENATVAANIQTLYQDNTDSITTYHYKAGSGQLDTTTTLQATGKASVIKSERNVFGEEESITHNTDFAGTQLTTLKKTNNRGLVTDIIVDPNGRNQITHFDYDAFGRVSAKTDARLNRIDYIYDKLGQVIELSDPTVDQSIARNKTSYDAFGRVLTQTDLLGHTTTYQYDKNKRSVTTITQEGITVETIFNRLGQTQTVTDANGVVTTYAYDKNGNLKTTERANVKTETVYNTQNQLARTIDGNGNIVDLMYDAASRIKTRKVFMEDGSVLETKYEYDAKGLQYRVTDPRGSVTQFDYYQNGQLKTQTVDIGGLNLTTHYEYDARGKTVRVTNPNGIVTKYVYDKSGRRTDEIQDEGGAKNTTHYEYDQNDNVISSTDANGKTTRYAYDADNRQTIQIDATGATQLTRYDRAGRIVQRNALVNVLGAADLAALTATPTQAAMQTAIATIARKPGQDQQDYRYYDQDNRLTTSITGGGSVTSLRYDKQGNVTEKIGYAKTLTASQLQQVSSDTWTEADRTNAITALTDLAHDANSTQSYDAFNRVAYSMDAKGAVTRNLYDANGNLTKQVHYAQAIAPTTTALAIASTVQSGPNDRVTLFIYDNANRQAYQVAANGQVTQYFYDQNGNLTDSIQFATLLAAPTINTNYALYRYGVSAKDSIEVQNAKLAVVTATSNLQQMMAAPVSNTAVTQAQANLAAANAALVNATTKVAATNSALTQATSHLDAAAVTTLAANTAVSLAQEALAQANQAKAQAQMHLETAIAAQANVKLAQDALVAVQAQEAQAQSVLMSAISVQDQAQKSLDQLQLALTAAQSALETATQHKQTTQALRDAKQAAAQAAQRHLEQMQSALQQAQAEVAAATAALTAATDNNTAESAQLTAATAVLNQAKEALESAQQAKTEADAAVVTANRVDTDVAAAQATVTQLQARLALDERSLLAIRGDVERASEQVQQQQAQLTLAQQVFDSATQAKATAQVNLVTAQLAQQRLETAVYQEDHHVRQVEQANTALIAAQAHQQSQTDQLALAVAEVARVQAQLAQALQVQEAAQVALDAEQAITDDALAPLQAAKAAAQAEVDRASEELTLAADQLASAKTEVDAAVAAQAAADAALTSALQVKTDADSALASAREAKVTRTNLTRELTSTQNKLQNANTNLIQIQETLSTAQIEVADATDALATAQAGVATADAAVVTATAEKTAAAEAYAQATPANRAALRAALAAATVKLRSAKTDLRVANRSLTSATTNLSRAQTRYDTRKAREETAQALIVTLNADEVRMRTDLLALGEAGTAADITDKQAQVRAAAAQVSAARSAVTAANNRVITSNDQLLVMQEDHDAAQAELVSVTAILVEESTNLDNATTLENARLKPYQETLTAARLAVEAANQQLTQAQQTADVAQAQLTIAVVASDAANAALLTAQERLAAVRAELTLAKADPAAYADQTALIALIERATQEWTTAQTQLTVATQALADALAHQVVMNTALVAAEAAQATTTAQLVNAQNYLGTVTLNQETLVAARDVAAQADALLQTRTAALATATTTYATEVVEMEMAASQLTAAQASLNLAQERQVTANQNLQLAQTTLTAIEADLAAAEVLVTEAGTALTQAQVRFDVAGGDVITGQAALATAKDQVNAAQVIAAQKRVNTVAAEAALTHALAQEGAQADVEQLRTQLTQTLLQIDQANQVLGARTQAALLAADAQAELESLVVQARTLHGQAQTQLAQADAAVVAAQTRLAQEIEASQLSAEAQAAKATLTLAQQSLTQAQTAQAAQQAQAGPPPAPGSSNIAVTSNPTLDRTSRFEYDAANRMKLSRDAAQATSRISYNDQANSVSTHRYSNGVSPSTNDRITQEIQDSAQRASYSIDARGSVTKTEYDGLGRVVKSTQFAQQMSPTGTLSLSALQALGNPTLDRSTRYTYTANGQLETVTDAAGHIESYTYNGLGQKESFTNKKNVTWNYEYDAAGRLSKEIAPKVTRAEVSRNGDGTFTTTDTEVRLETHFHYDALGNLTERIEAANVPGQSRTTRYGYDAMGRQISVTYPPVAVYNESADITSLARTEKDPVALTTTTTYDSLGNAIANVDVAGNYSYKTYDQFGRVSYEVDAMGYVTGYRYNSFNQVTGLTRYATAVSPKLQGAHADVMSAINAVINGDHSQDRTVETTYDQAGRATESKEPVSTIYDAKTQRAEQAAKVTKKTYNSFGEVETVTVEKETAGGLRATISTTQSYYDTRGQQVAAVDAMGHVSTKQYDAIGNLEKTIEYAISTENAAVRKANAAALSLIASAQDRKVEYTYDKLNRLKTETKVGIAYTTVGENRSVGNGVGATTQYFYDKVGNQDKVIDAAGGITLSQYDDMGRVTQTLTPGSGATNSQHLLTQYRRDAYGNVLAKIDINFTGDSFAGAPALSDVNNEDRRITYTQFDRNGHAIETTNANRHTSFVSYDALGRAVRSWQAVGTIISASTTTLTFDANNVPIFREGKVEQKVVQTSFLVTQYDALGNVIGTIQPGSQNQIATSFAQVNTRMKTNAFGEVTQVSTNGVEMQFAEYDNAGHVWRTNAGDGVTKVILNDIEGRATATVTSATQNLRTAYSSATGVADSQASGLVHVDTQYDALGHVTSTTTPKQGALTTVEVKPSVTAVGYSETVSNKPYLKGQTSGQSESDEMYYIVTHNVTLSLPAMQDWGNGDVKVVLDYKNPSTQASLVKTKIYSNEEARQKVLFSWMQKIGDLSNDHNLSQITIYKKSVKGEWIQVNQGTPTANSSQGEQSIGWNSVLRISAPADLYTTPVLKYSKRGSGVWETNAGLTNFGAYYIFDPKDITGNRSNPDPSKRIVTALVDGDYEYEIEYVNIKTNQKLAEAKASGQLTVGTQDARLQAAQLYVSLFNRAPTANELKSTTEAINALGMSAVAETLIGASSLAGQSAEQLLQHIFDNVLKLSLSAETKARYVAMWNSGVVNAHGLMIKTLIQDVVTYNQADPAKQSATQLLKNKVDVSMLYAYNMKGTSAVTAAAVIAKVTATSTVDAIDLVRASTAVASASTRMQVAQLYALLLNRAPDLGGLNHWANDLAANRVSIPALAGSFYELGDWSKLPSNKDVITQVFERVFGRKNAVEQAKWEVTLNAAGTSSAAKAQVLLDLMNQTLNDRSNDLEVRAAQELFNQRVTMGVYYAVGIGGNDLEKAKDVQAQTTLKDPFAAIQIAQAGATGEFADKIALTRLYVALFNRAPESDGFNYWLNARNNGMSIDDVASSMLQASPNKDNLTQLVTTIYSTVLGSSVPDSAKVQRWATQLTQSSTKGAVLQAMIAEISGYVEPVITSDAIANAMAVAERNIFNSKVVAGINYVSLGGNNVTDAQKVIDAVIPDINAMSATNTAFLAKLSSAQAQVDLSKFKLAEASTALAQALSTMESSAAELAYAKAQALATTTDLTAAIKVADDLKLVVNEAQKALTTAQTAKTDAEKLVAAADIAYQNAEATFKNDLTATAREALERAKAELNIAVENARPAQAAVVEAERVYALKVQLQKVADDDAITKRALATQAAALLATATTTEANARTAYQQANDVYQVKNDAFNAAAKALSSIQTGNAFDREAVYQWYVMLLNQTNPDIAGVEWWMNDLKNGRSYGDVAYSMSLSILPKPATNADLVKRLYCNNLGASETDSGVIKTWTDALNNADSIPSTFLRGKTFADMANEIRQFRIPDLAAAQANEINFKADRDRKKILMDQALVDLNAKQTVVDVARSNLTLIKSDSVLSKKLFQIYGLLFNRMSDLSYDPALIADVLAKMKEVKNNGKSLNTVASELYALALAQKGGGNVRTLVDFIVRKSLQQTNVDVIRDGVNWWTDQFNQATDKGALVLAYVQGAMTFDVPMNSSDAYKNKIAAADAQAKVSTQNQVHRKQVFQLQTLIFNKPTLNPRTATQYIAQLPAKVATWVAQLGQGVSIDEVAYNMFSWGVSLDLCTVDTVFQKIFNESLARPDAEAVTYYTGELKKATTNQLKGSVFVSIMLNVTNYSGSDPVVSTSCSNFNNKVLERQRDAEKDAYDYALAFLNEGINSRDTYVRLTNGSEGQNTFKVQFDFNEADKALTLAKTTYQNALDAYKLAMITYGVIWADLNDAINGQSRKTAQQNLINRTSTGMSNALSTATSNRNVAESARNTAYANLDSATKAFTTANTNYQNAITTNNAATIAAARADLEKAQADLDRSSAYAATMNQQISYGSFATVIQTAADKVASNLASGSNVVLSSAEQMALSRKLYDCKTSTSMATVMSSRYQAAQTDQSRILTADPAKLKTVVQLYVTLFNRVDPDIGGLSYWLNYLNSTNNPTQLATAMIASVPSIETLSATDMVKRLYELGLQRYDSDPKMSDWINRLTTLGNSAAAKGQIVIELITGLVQYTGPDQYGLQATQNFNTRVAGGLARLNSRAGDYVATVEQEKMKALGNMVRDQIIYDDAIKALGARATINAPVMTANAHHLNHMMQLANLFGVRTIDASNAAKISAVAIKLSNDQVSLDQAAYELFAAMNNVNLSNAEMIRHLYRDGLGRESVDVDGESFWLAKLNEATGITVPEARQAAIGSVLNGIVSGVMDRSNLDATAISTRYTFEYNMVSLFGQYKSHEATQITAALDQFNKATATLKTAQDALTIANASLSTGANAARLSVTPTIAASPAQTQIAQLYVLLFNRAPNAEGLGYWVTARNSADVVSVAAQMMNTLFNGLSNQAFVDGIYANLGEKSDQLSTDTVSKIAQHVQDLSTKSRAQVVCDILAETLPDQGTNIAAWNRQQLLANKVAVGLTYAILLKGNDNIVATQLFNNVTANSVEGGIADAIATDRTAQSRLQVAAVYALVLNKTPDLEGYDYWNDVILKTAGAEANWVQLIDDMMYADALANSKAGTSAQSIVNLSDDAFIDKMYLNSFGKSPDTIGKSFWLTQLKSMTRAQVFYKHLEIVQHGTDTGVAFKLNQKLFADKVTASLTTLAALTKARASGTVTPGAPAPVDQTTLDRLINLAAMARATADAADVAARAAINAIAGRILGPDVTFNLQSHYDWINIQTHNETGNAKVEVKQQSDRWGNVVSINDARNPGWVTKYSYNANNQLTQTTNALGFIATNSYDQLGRLVMTTDAKGNANHQRYDAAGHVVASYAAGISAADISTGYGVTSYVVNAFGDVKVKTDGSGVQTDYRYDNMGRQTRSTSSSVAFYTVSDLHYRGTASLAGSAQLITTYTYDELGRRINEVTGNHDANVTRYDLRGNIVSTTDSNGVYSRTEFDAMNRRVTSIDGNGNNRTWKYGTDSNAADFNRIQSVTNLSDVANGVTIGTVTANSYNQRGQITDEVNASTGKNIHTDYNDAGQITRINDLGTSTQTTYVYDDAGNRIHENITQQRDGNTLVLQDNYLGYDQLDRLRIIQDGHYFIEQDYDKNNNRTHVRSHYYGSKGLDNDVAIDQDLYSTYDAMNRQVLVDVNKDAAAVFDSRTGQLTSGNLNIANGHQFSYDGAGRRLTDTSIAKKIKVEFGTRGMTYSLEENTSLSTETYQYDAAGRLTGTLRDGIQTDLRYYDVRGNLVQSGMPGNMLESDSFKKALETLKLNNTTSLYQYENEGASTRLYIQQTINKGSGDGSYTGSATHYDAAGNITHITRDTTSVISYTYKHLDDYHIASVSNQRKKDGVTVTTTNRLDANGHLIETTDDAVGLDNHNRKLYVDTQGNILKKVQSNVTTRSLLVNGEIVGSRSNDGDVADDINQSYQSLRESGSSAFVFKVPAGGTSLGNIAKMVWGDSSLWYKIAEANGLPDGANVPENTLLNIPAREAANRNNTDTTKPYNSAKAIGDLTPVLPMPQGQDGCGPVGTIVTLAVAVALMIYNPPAGSALMKVAIAAANAAVASAAGQAAAVEAGEQERINWRSVAMSGLSGGIGAGLSIVGPLSGSGFGNVVARAAVSNALSQGIGVVTGLQTEPFRWKGVAAAAAGSAVSFVVGDALGKNTFNEALGDRMGGIARGTISGFAGGMTTAIARGGRVSVMQVFVDSFGNSIGQSYAGEGVGELSPNEIRGLDYDDPKMVAYRARNPITRSTYQRQPMALITPDELMPIKTVSPQELLSSLEPISFEDDGHLHSTPDIKKLDPVREKEIAAAFKRTRFNIIDGIENSESDFLNQFRISKAFKNGHIKVIEDGKTLTLTGEATIAGSDLDFFKKRVNASWGTPDQVYTEKGITYKIAPVKFAQVKNYKDADVVVQWGTLFENRATGNPFNGEIWMSSSTNSNRETYDAYKTNYVAGHEFGHAFWGLGDAYFSLQLPGIYSTGERPAYGFENYLMANSNTGTFGGKQIKTLVLKYLELQNAQVKGKK